MLTQYAAYDEIRAALGVAEEEITDLVLALPNYELMLQFELEELGTFSPTIDATYQTLIDSVATPLPTTDQKRFVNIMRVFSTYSVARQLTKSMTMFAPKTIKDSKTEMDRIIDPYSDTKAGIEQFYELMRARVLAAYLILFPSAVVAATAANIPLLAVSLSSDPVLGT